MPFIPDNTSADTANLLQLVEMNRKRKAGQFKNILDMALPGQTAEDLGVTPQQYKEATGNDLQPGTVLKPEMAADKLDRGVRTLLDSWAKDPTIIDKATPGSLDAIFSGHLAQMLGLSGDTTGPGLKAQQTANQTRAQTGVVQAQTQSDLVTDGANAWKAADAKTRGAAGQQLATGTTTSGIQNAESEQILQIAIKKQALKMVSDPNNAAWAPIKSLGINPILAVSAAATGMMPLLDQYANMVSAQNVARSQSESELSKLNSEWAASVSKATGGKLSPAVIAAAMNARLAGKEPTDPQSKKVYALIENATQMAYQAAMMDAFEKGNPYARALPEQLKLATGKSSDSQFNAVNDIITKQVSEALATQALGYPRPTMPGPDRDKWDRAAEGFQQVAPHSDSWITSTMHWAGDALNSITPPTPSGGGAPASAPPPATGFPVAPTASSPINLGASATGLAPTAAVGPVKPAGPSVHDLTDAQKAALAQILPFLMQGAAPAAPPPAQ